MKKINKINIISIILFLAILLMNLLTINIADDYGYCFSNGLIDIFKQEYIQYMTWNGRSIAHIIARLFLSLPKIVFDIANSFMFVYLTRLMYIIACKKKENWILYLVIIFSVFLFVPFFGQTILWETGACNYLWTTVIVLQFLLFYVKDKNINSFLLFILGIFAGWSNENTGGACILIAVLLTLYDVYINHKIKLRYILGIFGALIGFLILLIAPGNSIRALDFVNDNPLSYTLMHDFTSTISVIQDGLYVLLCSFVILLFLQIRKNPQNLIESSVFMLAAIADICAIIISPVPVLWDRSMFGAAIFAIISVGILFDAFELANAVDKYIISLISGCLIVSTCINYSRAILDLAYIRFQENQRVEYINQQKEKGNYDPIVGEYNTEFITVYNPLYGLGDLSQYYSAWLNEGYAKIHELNTIQSTSKEKWDLIYKEGSSELMAISDMNTYLHKVIDMDNLVIFLNCSQLDNRYSDYITQLEKNGIIVNDYDFFGIIIENGKIISNAFSKDGVELYGSINGKSYYIGSYANGSLSDIVIDNIEYTNNQDGINVVVFDKKQGKVIDSISFVLDYGLTGIRYEKR